MSVRMEVTITSHEMNKVYVNWMCIPGCFGQTALPSVILCILYHDDYTMILVQTNSG